MELCAQRLQTHPVYPRQNRLQQKCEYPSLLWNVLSWGQATQHAPCAQRKVVLSGLKIQAGWATGTTRVAVPPSPDRLVTLSFLFFFCCFCYTRVWNTAQLLHDPCLSRTALLMGISPHTFMSVSLGKSLAWLINTDPIPWNDTNSSLLMLWGLSVYTSRGLFWRR